MLDSFRFSFSFHPFLPSFLPSFLLSFLCLFVLSRVNALCIYSFVRHLFERPSVLLFIDCFIWLVDRYFKDAVSQLFVLFTFFLGFFFSFLFRFNLGKGKVIISTNNKLILNQWYHVEIIRVGLQGTLIVNYDQVFQGVAPGDWTNLDLQQAKVYLGGVSSSETKV